MLAIKENVPLAPLTSFRVGGNARFYTEARSLEELKEALAFAKEKNIDFYILSGGTNILVSDKGFAGLIIRMKMNGTKTEGTTLEVEAGVPLIKAVNTAAAEGLAGIESLAGIPGTVGGAVRGNAGAFGSETGQHILSVTAFDLAKSELVVFNQEECKFDYRSSVFKDGKNLIILSAKFSLTAGKSEEIMQKVKDTAAKRASTGLHGFKCAGSYFMNPVVTDKKLLDEFEKESGKPSKNGKLPAGWVIDRAGLRGKKIGGAMISEQHANYIINTGDATADDVVMLVSYAKQQVRDQLGIQLQEEVNYLGF
jgi:UDP-N-acetylmuramate dehydrogenase